MADAKVRFKNSSLSLSLSLSLSRSHFLSQNCFFNPQSHSLSHAQNFDLKKYFFSLSKTLSHQVPFSLSKPKSFETQIITYSLSIFLSSFSPMQHLSLTQTHHSLSLSLTLLHKQTNSTTHTSLSSKNYLSMLIAQALPTLYLSAYISLSHTQHPLSHSLLHSPLSLYLSIAHTHTRTHIFLKDSGKISSQLSKILKAAVQHENLCNGG